ncbi:MAG TPA: AbrB/MazE/SpoVT family DNA-binding domain-containing protein [Candidatus Nanoarchaeia archaeon]|nr:AbrB/MazE/SpoVT family DNA-binding domain-containing protein [Candidatus Nanoarchaeia archaeon]
MAVKFSGKARLTKQGQVTLPAESRQNLKIQPESDVFWYRGDGFLIVTKELMNEKDLESAIKGGKK